MEDDYNEPSAEEVNISQGMSKYGLQDPDLTRWQLSSDDVVLWIEHDLRGEIFDEMGRKWVVPEHAKALMNERGIREMISVVRNNINKITFLSNLDEEDIFILTRETHKDVAQLIARNYKYYGLDKSHFNLVVHKIVFMLYPALRRAWKEGERIHLRTVERRGYSYAEQQQQKGGGWSFNPFKSKDK